MHQFRLFSNYTIAQFNPYKSTCNETPIKNELNRQFVQEELAVVVSDVTYVRVESKWHNMCLFLNLYNREIIGYSAGTNKTAELVYKAISNIRANLNNVKMFHRDRGTEFDNRLISNVLTTFYITISLSNTGCPYDNSVAEAMFKFLRLHSLMAHIS